MTPSDAVWQQLISGLHASGRKAALAITGGGSGAIGELLRVPGGSRLLVEAQVPYDEQALATFLGFAPAQACSADTAIAMARTARARAAWADDATLDALVEAPWGKVPGRIALSGYVQEILTHGWDLARATGQPTELDPELAHWVLAVSRQILPAEPRGGEIPFGPPVPVPSDAGP